eukprot:TRINITY_DN12030_c0_g2_i1.p1 TRINITY_DN12030_c0_g2~~TRINITY_DN12030_c0_g2_i1.p1  ORF type:complete len:206 (+),score=19.33 TRINITY_DN12030_c0_g2_i1:355-972(+)
MNTNDSSINGSLLENFMNIQTQRAKLYNELKSSFTNLLSQDSHQNNQAYQSELQRLATKFNECSSSLKNLQNDQNENNNQQQQILSQMLDDIQQLEKQKLHVTLASYSLKKALKAEQFSWERRPYYQGEKEQQNVQDVITGFKMLKNGGLGQDQQMFDFVNNQMACKQDIQLGIQFAEQKLEQVIDEINELIYSIQETQTEEIEL